MRSARIPDDWSDGTVVVAYELAEPNWRLTVSDNGKTNPGLGTTIIEALAKQLNACVEVLMNPLGTTVSIYPRSVRIAAACRSE